MIDNALRRSYHVQNEAFEADTRYVLDAKRPTAIGDFLTGEQTGDGPILQAHSITGMTA